jgi:hypothetical protein
VFACIGVVFALLSLWALLPLDPKFAVENARKDQFVTEYLKPIWLCIALCVFLGVAACAVIWVVSSVWSLIR